MIPRLLDLGDGALTIEFGEGIAPELNRRVTTAAAALRRETLDGVGDIVPAYRSLTVHFDPLRISREQVAAAVAQLPAGADEVAASGCRWRLPAVFGGEHGPDLAAVAAATGRDAGEIVAAMCAIPFRVFLIGFLPGFPYMGELPAWLRLPRRAEPRTAVPAGSVAIAGTQAAIYPWQSPGGWHLLGRTPISLFDSAAAERPALLAPGDTVRFRPIDAAEYARLRAAPPGPDELLEAGP
jgi:KipI family sensor histidine kinase inhibitor